jgi:hypothetical protein
VLGLFEEIEESVCVRARECLYAVRLSFFDGVVCGHSHFTKVSRDRWTYVRGSRPIHVIFGWLHGVIGLEPEQPSQR